MKDVREHEKLEIDRSQSEDISSVITGDGYVHYNPAVRLGSALAALDRYRDKSWSEVEPEARRQWAEKHQRPWSEYQEVVRQAWAKASTQFSEDAAPVDEPDTFDAIFRKHYEANYSNSAYGYRQYAPAYHFGYDLAVDTRLRHKVWAEIEPAARRYWNDQSHAGMWTAFAEAVEYAWRKVRTLRNSTQ